MKSWLYQYERVDGDPEALERTLLDNVRDLLAAVAGAETTTPTREGDLLLRLPARVLGLDMHKTVRLRTGVVERHGPRVCIPLHWRADPARHLFPRFDGTIELDPQSRSTSHLAIIGAATLPLGPVGAAADATALGAVADRTLRHLVEGLAAALERAAQDPPARPHPAVTPPRQFQVRDVMTPLPLVLHEDMPLKTAALLLFHYGIAGAPVRSDSGGLVGVLSEADLLDVEAPVRYGMSHEALESRRRKTAQTVGQACTRPAAQVAAATSVGDAAALMREREVARLIVVDGSEIAGVVSRHDVLEALVRTDAETQRVLDELLAEFEDTGVTATVDWGVVHMRGTASTRSRTVQIVDQVERLDGVLAVDADLTWEIDDVVPPVPII
jgi:CBS domain-containing protein